MTSDVEKLGKQGEIVEVAKGYFTNYLLPTRVAVVASASNLKNLDATIKNAIIRENKAKVRIEEIAEAIKKQNFVLKAKSGPSGKLFGSITTADIAKVIRTTTKIELDKRKIVLEESIKTVGEHNIVLKLHPDVHLELKFTVETIG